MFGKIGSSFVIFILIVCFIGFPTTAKAQIDWGEPSDETGSRDVGGLEQAAIQNLGDWWFDQTRNAVEAYVRRHRVEAKTFEDFPSRIQRRLQNRFSMETLRAVRVYMGVPLTSVFREIGLANRITAMIGGELPDAQTFGNAVYMNSTHVRNEENILLLVHEIVHVAQYRSLGYEGFKERYKQALLQGRSYRDIPLESKAYSFVRSRAIRKLRLHDIVVRAKGTTGEEEIALNVGGTTVNTFQLSRVMNDYDSSTNATGDITVEFINDGKSYTGANRDVQIDRIVIDELDFREAEAQRYNSGAFANGRCGGGSQTEWMHCDGAIGFGGLVEGFGMQDEDTGDESSGFNW